MTDNGTRLNEPKRGIVGLYDWARIIVSTLCVCCVLFTFVFRMAFVEGRSMEDLLINGNAIIVTTLGYYPKTGEVIAIKDAKMVEWPIIKRVIAVPGQTIRIDSATGNVYVDEVLLEEKYIKDVTSPGIEWDCPYEIPKNKVFVMGDNRIISQDSRDMQVGLIDVSNIIGRASLVVFPFSNFKIIS